MHPHIHAVQRPDQPAYIMAATQEVVTYKQLNDRSNQVAQLARARGLKRGDGVAIFMDNNVHFLEIKETKLMNSFQKPCHFKKDKGYLQLKVPFSTVNAAFLSLY